jgi:hypothetical protein
VEEKEFMRVWMGSGMEGGSGLESKATSLRKNPLLVEEECLRNLGPASNEKP